MEDKILAALISAIAALVGVIVGGILSRWTTYSLEKKRWQREDARRFDLERRQAYVRFLRIVNQLNFSSAEKIPSELETEFANTFTEIEMLASPTVYKNAWSFAQAVNDQIFNRGEKQLSVGAWGESRKNLIESIHREMGIESHYSLLRSEHEKTA